MHFLEAAFTEVEVNQFMKATEGLFAHRSNRIWPQGQAHQVLTVFNSRGGDRGQSIITEVKIHQVGEASVRYEFYLINFSYFFGFAWEFWSIIVYFMRETESLFKSKGPFYHESVVKYSYILVRQNETGNNHNLVFFGYVYTVKCI